MKRRGAVDGELMSFLGIMALVSIGFCAIGFIWHNVGWQKAENATRAEAIEAGVGYWAIDEKTGEKRFEWRTETKEKE